MSEQKKWIAIVKDEKTARLILSDGEVELDISYEGPPTFKTICRDASFVQDVYEKGYYRARTTYASIELSRLEGARRWLLRARGLVEYDVELTQEEALLMALIINDMREDTLSSVLLCRLLEELVMETRADMRIAAAILRDRLGRAMVKGISSSGFVEPRDCGFIFFIEDPGQDARFRLIKLEGKEITGLEGGVVLDDREALRVLMGIIPVEKARLDERAERRICIYIIRSVLGPLAKRVKFKKGLAIVKNYGLTWAIDLSDGDLIVNGEHICTTFPFFARRYGFLKLPGLGKIGLMEDMASVLCNILYALMPTKIRDPDLCRQILAKLSFLGDITDWLPCPCLFFRLWLKLRRWLRPPRFLRALLRD